MSLFKTDLITQPNDFLALAPEWNDLLDRSDIHTLFLTWEWVLTWYQTVMTDQQLWLITVRDQENGQLMAVAPLMLQQRKIASFIPLNELCFLTSNVGSDHLDFILDQQQTENLVNELSEFIKNQSKPWDIIHLEASRENAIAHRVFNSFTSQSNCYPTICPYLDLPDSWKNYLQSLGKKRRYKINAYRRKLEQAFENKVTYQQVKTIEELNSCLPELFALHQQAQQAQGRKGAFAEPSRQKFHQQICHHFLANDWLRLFFLRVDDKPIAVVYSFFYYKRISFYTTGFDLEWSAHSPGQQIIYHALEQVINEKAEVFDFLRGDEDYKFMMTKTTYQDQRFIAPQSFWGHAVAWAFKQKKARKK